MQQLKMKLLNDITWEKPNPTRSFSCRCFTHSTETVIWKSKNESPKHIFHYQAMPGKNSGKQMKTVWNIKPPEKKEKEFSKHPTQKPLELLCRIIEASTNEGDLIFDPFSGISKTGVASILSKRKFVGHELESKFIDISQKRLNT